MSNLTSQLDNTPARKDSAFFYNLRGVLIILVVFGHVLEQFYNSSSMTSFLYKEIYFFHMPMFVILAGYFSSAGARLVNLVKSLIYPYVVAQLFYAVSDNALFGANIWDSMLRPNWGMWFLICLFVWRAIWPFVCKTPHLLSIATLLAIACGYADSLDITLSRIIVFFPFFVIGCRWSENGGMEQGLQWLRSAGPAILLASIVAQLLFLAADFAPAWLYGKFSYSVLGYSQWWAGGVRLATLVAAGLGIMLCLATTTSRKCWLTYVGKCSLFTYLAHFFFIDLLVALDVPVKVTTLVDSNWAFIFVISSLIAVTAIAILNLPAVQSASDRVLRPHKAGRIGK